MPEISVIIPSYNHAAYVGAAIESIQAQAGVDWELVIIDDASSDDSVDVIASYAERDPRIRWSRHRENRGMSHTINEAMDQATGRYLVLGASDDVFVPGAFSKLLEEAGQWADSATVVLMGYAVKIDEQGREIQRVDPELSWQGVADILNPLLQKSNLPFYIQALLIPRAGMGAIRWDPSLKVLNEYRFAIDLATRLRFVQTNTLVVQHRIHGRNLCLNSDPNVVACERAAVVDALLGDASLPLTAKTRRCLVEYAIESALLVQDTESLQKRVLQWLSLTPRTLAAVRDAFAQTDRLPQITLTFDRVDRRVADVNLRDLGIGREQIAALCG